MTPRKPKPRQQLHRPTVSLSLVSDYESDIPQPRGQAPNQHAVPPPTRTNTELNLAVLRRYNPGVLTILSIAANAVIYTFTPATQAWEKSGVEGTLFVCETQAPPGVAVDAGYVVVVLNRRGLDNLILDLARAEDVEVAAELLIMRFREDDDDTPAKGQGEDTTVRQKVVGLWIHEDKDGAREVNAGLIQQCWEKVATAMKAQLVEDDGAGGRNGSKKGKDGAVMMQGNGTGRKISLSDLFRQGSAQ